MPSPAYPFASRSRSRGESLLGGGSSETPNQPVLFTGFPSNNVMLRSGGLSPGLIDTKIFSFAVWVRLIGAQNSRIWQSNTNTIEARITSAFRVQVIGVGTSGGTRLNVQSDAATPLPNGDWAHVQAFINLDDQAASNILINGVGTMAVTTFSSADTLDFTTTPIEYYVGSATTVGDTAFFAGDMADLWFDQSFENDNTLFFSPTRTPVAPVPDGLVRLTGPVDDWHVNKGTGIGFIKENGDLLLGQEPIQAP